MKAASAHNQHGADHLAETAGRLKEDVQELTGAIRDASQEVYKSGRGKVVQFQKTASKRIADNPIQSVLIAAGVGFVAGFLLRRR
jgi:ElaB/YqjD/DUF883 family membrane-anchored ribosome-binding protein